VPLAKEETGSKGMNYRLTETGRCYGVEVNVEDIKVMRMSRKPPPPPPIMVDQKQLPITSNAR
jgi:hypothetical protein